MSHDYKMRDCLLQQNITSVEDAAAFIATKIDGFVAA